MRKDILIHVDSGDLRLSNGFRPIAVCTVTDTGTEVLLSLEIEDDWRWATFQNTGQIPVNIPYTPINKPAKVRVVKKKDGETVSMTTTKPLQYNSLPINACAISAVDIENHIVMMNAGNTAYNVYPGNSYDFSIGNANPQNKAALLDCNPGNNYRYPTIGVGLINWLGATSDLSGLGQKLMEEFAADGTPVINARYIAETKTMYLDLDTRNVDANEDL